MKNQRKISLFIGSFIVLLIVCSPYLLFFHTSLPKTPTIETVFGTIQGGHFGIARNYIYWLSSKIVPLLLLLIWFLTNKNWWVHALIIPISVYVFQFLAVINDGQGKVDEIEFIYSVPVTVIVLVILYYLRSNLAVYIMAVDLKKEMDDKLDQPIKKIE